MEMELVCAAIGERRWACTHTHEINTARAEKVARTTISIVESNLPTPFYG